MTEEVDNKLKFYTPEQVAKMFQVNVRTIRRYCRDGILLHVKIRRLIRIRAIDLEELL